MLRKIFFIILFCFVSSSAFSQYYPEVWDSTIVYENEYYKIEVPKKWRDKGGDNNVWNFGGTGVGFPTHVNDSSLNINIGIFYAGKVVSQDSLIGIYNFLAFKDKNKVFPKNFEPVETNITIKSGEQATIIKQRYFQKSNKRDVTSYSMILQNPKTGEGFFYGIVFLYSGDYDSFESYMKMDEFADNVYKRFELK